MALCGGSSEAIGMSNLPSLSGESNLGSVGESASRQAFEARQDLQQEDFFDSGSQQLPFSSQ